MSMTETRSRSSHLRSWNRWMFDKEVTEMIYQYYKHFILIDKSINCRAVSAAQVSTINKSIIILFYLTRCFVTNCDNFYFHPHSQSWTTLQKCWHGRWRGRSTPFSPNCPQRCSVTTRLWRPEWDGWRASWRRWLKTTKMPDCGEKTCWAAARCCSSRAGWSTPWSLSGC